MKIKKLLLVSPSYTVFKDDVRRCIPPIGLMYIASVLENNGYEVKILDVATEGYTNLKNEGRFVTYGLKDEAIIKEITKFSPDVVGVSCIFSSQQNNAKSILRLVKSIDKNIITFTGGSHPTYSLDETLKNKDIDYVILHEGEFATLELIEKLNNLIPTDKAVFSEYVKDLDTIPFPARHLLDMEKYFNINLPQSPYPKGKRVSQLVTSRGCVARCVFCTTTNFWGNRYRSRSADNVIKELEILKYEYRVDEIQITDDNFTLNRSRAKEIIDKMRKFNLYWCMPQGVFVPSLDGDLLKKMYDSGCYQLTFALESGNQDVVDNIVKKPLNLKKVKPLVKIAHDIGIKVHGFFVCGLPGETKDQMNQTYKFANDIGLDSASFFMALPLVGSELMEICKKNSYIRKGLTYNDMLCKVGNISTPEFTSAEAEEMVRTFNIEFNKDDKRKKKFEKGKY